jgi:hypothetical protein
MLPVHETEIIPVWVRVWRKDVRELAKGQTNGARDDPG